MVSEVAAEVVVVEKPKPVEQVNYKQLSALIDAKQEFTTTSKPLLCFAFSFLSGFMFHSLFCIFNIRCFNFLLFLACDIAFQLLLMRLAS